MLGGWGSSQVLSMKIGVICARQGRSPDKITQSSHPGCRRRLKKSKSHISPKITMFAILQHQHTNFCTINPDFDRKSIHHIYKNPTNNQKSMIPLPQPPKYASSQQPQSKQQSQTLHEERILSQNHITDLPKPTQQTQPDHLNFILRLFPVIK